MNPLWKNITAGMKFRYISSATIYGVTISKVNISSGIENKKGSWKICRDDSSTNSGHWWYMHEWEYNKAAGSLWTYIGDIAQKEEIKVSNLDFIVEID